MGGATETMRSSQKGTGLETFVVSHVVCAHGGGRGQRQRDRDRATTDIRSWVYKVLPHDLTILDLCLKSCDDKVRGLAL